MKWALLAAGLVATSFSVFADVMEVYMCEGMNGDVVARLKRSQTTSQADFSIDTPWCSFETKSPLVEVKKFGSRMRLQAVVSEQNDAPFAQIIFNDISDEPRMGNEMKARLMIGFETMTEAVDLTCISIVAEGSCGA